MANQVEQYTTLQIPVDLHRDWKVFVAKKGGKIKEFTAAVLLEHMQRQTADTDQAA
jgi:uncharacterized protein YegJ (DUF2314 family)